MTDTPRGKRIIGYLSGESVDETLLRRLDTAAGMLTHINYAFGLVGKDGRATIDDVDAATTRAFPGDEGGPAGLRGNFRQLQLLKARHPHLRTLISMGGWGGSWGFSDIASTAGDRERFAASAIELFLTRWPGVFDGIDIDWEYPVHGGMPGNGYRPEDRRNCTLLFEEFRRQLDELGTSPGGERYLLTAAIPAGRQLPMSTFELQEIGQILDFVNLMTYDINGSGRSGITNFNAALRPVSSDPGYRDNEDARYQNVVGTVETFLGEGIPRDNLVVGMPFYGRGYLGVPPENDGLYQPFEEPNITAAYRDLMASYLPSCERHWHEEAGVPWLYCDQNRMMMSYDDPESLRGKAEFVRDEGLGGAMFWDLKCDDDQWSLLSAVSGVLGS